jgi:putative ABC transport system ATP-binding protein
MRLTVENAALQFGGRQVFSGFSAVFEPGMVTALVGPSGSGKSSILAALCGYQKLSVGTIILTESTGQQHGPDPSLVAWVPQGSNALRARTAVDNVCVAPLSEGRSLDQARQLAREALEVVGLGHAAEQRARTLSGGELQRMSFARALASDRPLLFADEPSASLDEDNTVIIAKLLTKLNVSATIIVATHDPILIAAADSVVSLRHGSEHAA